MIKTDIIHPDLLQALAEAGHGARILVADGNYPVTVKSNPRARRVFLNFRPGMVGGVDIVRALAGAIPIESAFYMTPPDGKMPEIVAEYKSIIGDGIPYESLERFAFYDASSTNENSLVIATGEQRIYANILLVVGVRQ